MGKIYMNKNPQSLKFAVIGSGQAGGRFAETFYKKGYEVLAINTASQDLALLSIPEENKLCLNYSLGGAGKNLDIGKAAAESNSEKILKMIKESFDEPEVFIFCLSGAGGSGSGSCPVIIDLLRSFDKPIIVIYALPGNADDNQGKFNALSTLSTLGDYAAKQIINTLILADNAKIEVLLSGKTTPKQFWKEANNQVISVLDEFNKLSALPTDYDACDPMDFSTALLENGGCFVMGSCKVSVEDCKNDDTHLLQSIAQNVLEQNGLFASGFDLKEAQAVGLLISASKKVLEEEISYMSIASSFAWLTTEFESAKVFKGVYELPDESDEEISVRFVFSGLGMPKDRVEELKAVAEDFRKKAQDKKTKVATDLKVAVKTNVGSSKDNDLLKSAANKNSFLSKLLTNGAPKKK